MTTNNTIVIPLMTAPVRYKGKLPLDKRGKVKSPETMREDSLAKNQTIRIWVAKNAVGTKPSDFPDPYPSGFLTSKGQKNRIYA